jgi:hypothetical protein
MEARRYETSVNEHTQPVMRTNEILWRSEALLKGGVAWLTASILQRPGRPARQMAVVRSNRAPERPIRRRAA